ncbi:MAG TPA: pyridoxamine 5'-phosphate oxidase family protein, partial [Spongiibacteraceae bacterium]|nr:pyridoxamine 5'-phosphate oxidase family protein [Spongiibacteraceae bacterium]
MRAGFSITNVQELEAVIGERQDWVKCKIFSELDSVMKAFIARSPLMFVSTTDENGYVDVSPKGDPAGFVLVDDDGCLLIPERPGNKLTYGFRNILRNGGIGLLFLLPRQRETLRVKGIATLHNDPDVLEKMKVNGKPALMYTRVEIKECFIH